MNRFWRLLLATWLIAALSWQGVASASMVMCHGKGAGSAAATVSAAATLAPQGHEAHAHEASAAHEASGHSHAAHGAHHHDPSGASQDIQASPGPDLDGAHGTDHVAATEGGLSSHACTVCACCAHALGLGQAPVAWPDRMAPIAPPEAATASFVQRSMSVPDKPPRA